MTVYIERSILDDQVCDLCEEEKPVTVIVSKFPGRKASPMQARLCVCSECGEAFVARIKDELA